MKDNRLEEIIVQRMEILKYCSTLSTSNQKQIAKYLKIFIFAVQVSKNNGNL